MLKQLHRRMFDRTWRWAGSFRTSDANIGVHWPQIAEDLKNLCDDVVYQSAHSVYPPDETAVRFHHRLVLIHPFPNGNGRHARLAADLLIRRLGGTAFGWGSATLVREGTARQEYLAALREADGGNLERLIGFARTEPRSRPG
jgi:Fic-DOC domain mobile mystery protein B